MRRTFVQCAELLLEPGADAAAPGGAVTLALCGSWDHAGACRWPHETAAAWDERQGRLRVVFAAEAEDENHIRTLIEQALAGGECVGPDGKRSHWTVTEHSAGVLSESEEALGSTIAESRGGV
ncbi:MAG: hypothetical protein ABJF10_20480 [Chthoniobacter sp.]|uniref:hypothetical protein n=1 Tax=Chthoniobacter sp. TaxID=2510640 RepID=UPI0032AC74A3